MRVLHTYGTTGRIKDVVKERGSQSVTKLYKELWNPSLLLPYLEMHGVRMRIMPVMEGCPGEGETTT